MSRGKKALVALLVATAAWAVAVQQVFQATAAGLPAGAAERYFGKERRSFYYTLLFSPLLFAGIFGIYAAATIAWQTSRVERKNEAAAALEEDLQQAEAGLEKLGFNTFSSHSGEYKKA